MNAYFDKVRDYLLELDFSIISQDAEEGILVVEKEDEGMKNVVLIVSDPIVIVEQFLFELTDESLEVYKRLLIKNRDIIHGAFAIDESGKKVFFP
jgi:hypothetical protein